VVRRSRMYIARTLGRSRRDLSEDLRRQMREGEHRLANDDELALHGRADQPVGAVPGMVDADTALSIAEQASTMSFR
jgi:hypothetical protein